MYKSLFIFSKKLKIPKLIKSDVKTGNKGFSKENYTYSVIKNKLKEEYVDVSLSSICRVLNGIGISRHAGINGEKKPKKCSNLFKPTPEIIKKIKGYVTKESHMSHCDIKKETSLSLGTINKIIRQDINLKTRKKVNVHGLFSNHKKMTKPSAESSIKSDLQGIGPIFSSHWTNYLSTLMVQMVRVRFVTFSEMNRIPSFRY